MARGASRIKQREATWRRIVAGHSKSGVSIRAYCAKHGVKEPAFCLRRAELARRDAAAKDAAKPKAAYVPVVVKPPAARAAEGILIELRDGRGGRSVALPGVELGKLLALPTERVCWVWRAEKLAEI